MSLSSSMSADKSADALMYNYPFLLFAKMICITYFIESVMPNLPQFDWSGLLFLHPGKLSKPQPQLNSTST